MHADPAGLTERQVYKLLAGSVLPRPIAWITTVDEQGVRNAAPFSFFNVMASDPPLVGFGSGKRRPVHCLKDTDANIRATGEFMINIVPVEMAEVMHKTAADWPPEVDELERAGLIGLPGMKIRPPRIQGSPVQFECVLETICDLTANYDWIVGRVVMFHVSDPLWDAKREYVRIEGWQPLGRHIGNSYFRPGETFTIGQTDRDQSNQST